MANCLSASRRFLNLRYSQTAEVQLRTDCFELVPFDNPKNKVLGLASVVPIQWFDESSNHFPGNLSSVAATLRCTSIQRVPCDSSIESRCCQVSIVGSLETMLLGGQEGAGNSPLDKHHPTQVACAIVFGSCGPECLCFCVGCLKGMGDSVHAESFPTCDSSPCDLQRAVLR